MIREAFMGVYYCMHDRLPPEEMYSGSRDVFNFWEITNNISKTVQDRDIVTMEDWYEIT